MDDGFEMPIPID